MNVSMEESKISSEIFIEPSIRVLNLEEGEEKDGTGIFDNSASIQNPNKDDSRRLFQVYKPDFTWDPSMPYDELPIRLEEEGPVPLDFPAHFYDVEGGISVIYWEEDRSRGCLCTILGINELDETFTYQALSLQGKKKSTFFDTGRTMEAKESKVWRLVHRTEFERSIEKNAIKEGQTLRILLKSKITDFTGIVQERREQSLLVSQLPLGGLEGDIEFKLSEIVTAGEIMYSQLFCNLRELVNGGRGKKNNIM